MSDDLEQGLVKTLHVSSFEARCPHCGASNNVTIKRSFHSGWNDKTMYSCAGCHAPMGARAAFCIETAEVGKRVRSFDPTAG